ncbi:MAG: ribosome small subunit-dependent GTPase A [Synechococcus sp. BS307-5m-G36]|nr:ribosome small subunit-dependent GTPase A [Synechococcus sp. BS307-5m-G36]MBL6880135.1 ribosome small subunit-dependent GTPase A [Synechococcus sp. BS30m-G31]
MADGSGIVVALQANYLEVELDDAPQGCPLRLLCTRRSRLTHRGTDVNVGDRVRVEAIDAKQARAVVAEVSPRQSWLTRPPVANVSLVVVALAVDQPAFDPDQASRFLLTAERTGLDVQLVLTKVDLVSAEVLSELCERLRGWGYDPLPLSSESGSGMEVLQTRLQGTSLAVLCGPSGVGKSSVLNNLLPHLSLRVGAVSGRLQRGRHTTRHVELFPIGDQARVADTPGFNRPELPDDPQELGVLFPELRRQLDPWPCRFRDCLHRGEPGCGVSRTWERYDLYAKALEEVVSLSRPFRGG